MFKLNREDPANRSPNGRVHRAANQAITSRAKVSRSAVPSKLRSRLGFRVQAGAFLEISVLELQSGDLPLRHPLAFLQAIAPRALFLPSSWFFGGGGEEGRLLNSCLKLAFR